MRNRHLIGLASVVLLLGALGCSGGAMNEVESESVTGASEPAAEQPAESTDTAATETPEANTPPATAETSTPSESSATPYEDPDVASYQRRLTQAVQADWDHPGRGNYENRRIGVAILFLGSNGQIERWTWRRRSPDGPFNASVSSHLDELMRSGAQLPLAPMRGGVRARLAEEGVTIEFADE